VIRRFSILAALVLTAVLAGLTGPATVLAHGVVPADPPSFGTLVLGWHLEPSIAVGLLAAAAFWTWIVRRVARNHPLTPVPRVRTAAWFAGLATIAVALMSGIERYDTTLFSIHMVQHLLLMLVAAPLVVLAAPMTQLLRAASPEVRRRWLLPVLHSTVVGVIGHPIVAWLAFTLVMWVSHFSPLFDLALENPGVHQLEHAIYLGSALLFWWPAVAADPSQHRLGHAARAMYVLVQFPLNSFLGMAIFFAGAALYPHYATLGSPYGITALVDQEFAGGIMWLGGDIVFVTAVLAIVAGWMRAEERDTSAAERRADSQRGALRERADRLERSKAGALSGPGPAAQSGSGDSSSAR
jgi:putative copper resistance protein D